MTVTLKRKCLEEQNITKKRPRISSEFLFIENCCIQAAKEGKEEYFYEQYKQIALEIFFTDNLIDFEYTQNSKNNFGYLLKW